MSSFLHTLLHVAGHAYRHSVEKKEHTNEQAQRSDQSLIEDKNPAVAFNNRGADRLAQDDLDGAIADFDEAIRRDGRFAIAFNNRGLARQRKQDLVGSISDLDEAIRLNPGYAPAFFNRGRTHREANDLNAAVRDIEEAQRLAPSAKYLAELGYVRTLAMKEG
jgi:tetratricopeptide (TPR) repeat protein